MKLVGQVRGGLLIDTNLLVLFCVGTINPKRIETFKRTRQYTVADFHLLLDIIRHSRSLYTTPHVLSEVSNLTDLKGAERPLARKVLKETISSLLETELTSLKASNDPSYEDHGLVDAAIVATARSQGCTVLTDDLDLYLRLRRDHLECAMFAHLRARMLGL